MSADVRRIGRIRRIALLIILAATLTGVAGCSMLGLGGGGGSGSSASSGPTDDGKQEQLPENTIFEGGQAVASPSSGLNGSPIRTPLGALPSWPTSTYSYSYDPSAFATVCEGRLRQGVINGLDTTAGTGRAQVSWWEVGDPALVSYELAAVSQNLKYGTQRPWKWTNLAKAGTCRRMTTTVTGLTSGDYYIFVLHAVIRNYENVPPIVPEIGRSAAVLIK
jgi:hypothetical protein